MIDRLDFPDPGGCEEKPLLALGWVKNSAAVNRPDRLRRQPDEEFTEVYVPNLGEYPIANLGSVR